MSNSYRDLLVWQQGMDLVELVYRLVASLPATERYELSSQMRRAAVSVVSNIAEGQGRNTKGEFLHFLGNAKGSLLELETQIFVSERLGFFERAQLTEALEKLDRVSRLLNGLMHSLK